MASETVLRISDFQDLYKNVGQLKDHQAKRRERLLEERKQKRDDEFAKKRQLKDILEYTPKKDRCNFMFKNNLMLSEWMMARPDDIEDFVLVPCPKGIRCSLSTGENRKKTAKLYYRNGCKFLELKTNLPAYTILDVIYCKASQTIYVLDVLYFNDRDMLDSDSALRFFWLESKFAENVFKVSDQEQNLEFKLLPHFALTDPYAVSSCFDSFPMFQNDVELDGYLFYHKEGSYTAGETPFVLWLFPFMVEELFNDFKVNSSYYQSRPGNYTNYLQFIKEFDENSKKRKKKSNISDSMELETTISSLDESRDEMDAMIDLEMT